MNVSRKDVSPVWTRSFPVSKEPQSIGEHLRKKRFSLSLRQSEAAAKLGISKRTLGLGECDRVYPTWPHHPKLIAYLGYDPFTDPSLGNRKSNETQFVAFLSPDSPASLGHQIWQRRLQLKKTRKQFATELGVSVKTLRDWETNRRQPIKSLRKRIEAFLGFDPELANFTGES